MDAKNKVISQDVLDVFYIISCALHDEKPDESILSSFNLNNIYRLSDEQSIGAITFMGLQKSEYLKTKEPELYDRWDKYQKQAMRKNLLLDIEREKLAAFMEENKIWYMPLKGSVLQNIYPVYGMRQMGDNDILFDSNFRKEIRDHMISEGYKVEEYNEGHHDTYFKPNIYFFEMHVGLLGRRHNPEWYDYYANVKDRLVQKEGTSYEYRFTDEDFYIFQVIHAYKHYLLGNMGLRHLADTYVYLSAKKNTMDAEYLDGELSKLGAKDYADTTEKLCFRLLSQPVHYTADMVRDELTKEEFDMLYSMQISATYGTRESKIEAEINNISIQNKNAKNKKLSYYWKRAFPDDEWWRRISPFCFKHVWARPFYNVYRLVRGLTVRRKKLAREIDMVNEKMGD